MTEPVINTSPLIHLGDAGRLDLLRDLFGGVFVPSVVRDELLAKGDGDRAAREFSTATWVRIIDIEDIPPSIVAWDLGAGESAVLTHALREPNTEAIVDDLSARRCAQSLGIPVCGTLGLVLRAARKGIVGDPAGLLVELRNAGMWLSPGLFQEVIEAAREFQ